MAALAVSSALDAQVAGSIAGYVKDPSGAALGGAGVQGVSGEQQFTPSGQAHQNRF
jgi:hypothetical protein